MARLARKDYYLVDRSGSTRPIIEVLASLNPQMEPDRLVSHVQLIQRTNNMTKREFLQILALTALAGCFRNLIGERRNRPAILDFDGTLTDTEKEGVPFTEGCIHDLGALLKGAPIERLWSEADAVRVSRREDFTWNANGFLTGPASDPYLRANVIVDLILDKMELYSQPQERREIKKRLFLANRSKAITSFRPGAKEYLEEMVATTATVIVTNNDTNAVQAKLEGLNPRGCNGIILYGNAAKYKIDPTWTAVPEGQYVEDLDRPVLLRRKMYFDILTKIANSLQVPINEMFFLGDIYDMDLALPQFLGANTALITREETYSYERRAAQKVVNDLNEAWRVFRA